MINNIIVICVTLTPTLWMAPEHTKKEEKSHTQKSMTIYHDQQILHTFQADPIQLKSLLTILRLVAKGDDASKLMSVGSMQPPSTTGMKALQTSMVVTSRKDYPLTTSFPSALQNLTVCCCCAWVRVIFPGTWNSQTELRLGFKVLEEKSKLYINE